MQISKIIPKLLVAISVSALLYSGITFSYKAAQELFLSSGMWDAVHMGDTVRVQRLLKRGANINRIGAGAYAGGTPLTWATEKSNTAMMKLLVQNGANVNKNMGRGWTALMYAETPEAARCLLRLGADPNMKTDDGDTALQVAKVYGRPRVAAVLKPVTRP